MRIAKAQSPAFVLVHGAWHGGWCWDRLRPLLAGDGAASLAPTLPGLGDRAARPEARIDLDSHADAVIAAIEDHHLRDVVLVGHSYGGVVITAVADRRPDLLARLVFLDALIVEAGESIASRWLTQADHQHLQQEHAAGIVTRPPLPARSFDITDPGDLAWTEPRLTPHPSATYLQKLRLAHAFGNGLPRSFIFCTQATNPMIGTLRGALPGPEEWDVHDLHAGHDAMITAPQALAGLLLSIARKDADHER